MFKNTKFTPFNGPDRELGPLLEGPIFDIRKLSYAMGKPRDSMRKPLLL